MTCRNARNAMIPMKNDKSAISTHANKANAKDKPSIGSMLSLLVGWPGGTIDGTNGSATREMEGG